MNTDDAHRALAAHPELPQDGESVDLIANFCADVNQGSFASAETLAVQFATVWLARGRRLERERCVGVAVLVAEVEAMAGGGARGRSATCSKVARHVGHAILDEAAERDERTVHAARVAFVGADALATIRAEDRQ